MDQENELTQNYQGETERPPDPPPPPDPLPPREQSILLTAYAVVIFRNTRRELDFQTSITRFISPLLSPTQCKQIFYYCKQPHSVQANGKVNIMTSRKSSCILSRRSNYNPHETIPELLVISRLILVTRNHVSARVPRPVSWRRNPSQVGRAWGAS